MILSLDLETTHLNEHRGGLVGIGAVWLHSGECFYRRCSPREDAEIDPEAMAVNGIAMDDIQGHLPEVLAIVEFLGWVRGGCSDNRKVQMSAWNAHFDHRHVMASIARAGVPGKFSPFAHRLLDVHSILASRMIVDVIESRARNERMELVEFSKFGGEIANSDAGSEVLGLPPEPKPHNALTGAKQARAMLRRLFGDTGALP